MLGLRGTDRLEKSESFKRFLVVVFLCHLLTFTNISLALSFKLTNNANFLVPEVSLTSLFDNHSLSKLSRCNNSEGMQQHYSLLWFGLAVGSIINRQVTVVIRMLA